MTVWKTLSVFHSSVQVWRTSSKSHSSMLVSISQWFFLPRTAEGRKSYLFKGWLETANWIRGCRLGVHTKVWCKVNEPCKTAQTRCLRLRCWRYSISPRITSMHWPEVVASAVFSCTGWAPHLSVTKHNWEWVATRTPLWAEWLSGALQPPSPCPSRCSCSPKVNVLLYCLFLASGGLPKVKDKQEPQHLEELSFHCQSSRSNTLTYLWEKLPFLMVCAIPSQKSVLQRRTAFSHS